MRNHGNETIAHLTPEEIQEFKKIYEEELGLKAVVDTFMETAQGMGRELVKNRRKFWDELLSKHNLEHDEKYAIDIHAKTLISVTE